MNNKSALFIGGIAAIIMLTVYVAPPTMLDKILSDKYLAKLDKQFIAPFSDVLPVPAFDTPSVNPDAGKELSNLPDDLPVGEITVFPADNAWGTAIYTPQNHRYPGTSLGDAKNDSAQLAQEQIYQIQSYLYDQYHIDYFMAEGDLYGAVPEDKISALNDKIALRDQLADNLDNLETALADDQSAASFAGQLREQGDKTLAALDREIILAGAAYKLKAENNDGIALYGAENGDTRDKCTVIVRNYIYEQDQLAQCSSGTGGSLAQAQTGGTTGQNITDKLQQFKDKLLSANPDLKQMIDKLGNMAILDLNSSTIGSLGAGGDIMSLLTGANANPFTMLNSTLSYIETFANGTGHSDLTGLVGQVKSTCQSITDMETAQTVTPADAPSRQDNPYAGISDPDKLQGMIDQSEQDINDYVIDQRNREAADYFAQGLKEVGANVGVLQYGAGHEDGLVKELNNEGLTVIVVKPDEVLRREQLGE